MGPIVPDEKLTPPTDLNPYRGSKHCACDVDGSGNDLLSDQDRFWKRDFDSDLGFDFNFVLQAEYKTGAENEVSMRKVDFCLPFEHQV